MATKQELQESIKKMVVVANNPKTSEAIRKTLLKSIEKAESQVKELEKAETLEKKEELTEKQEQKVEETKEESKELVQELKQKIAKAKSQVSKAPVKKVSGATKSMSKAKQLAKKYRTAQKGVPTGDYDIERDAGRPAMPKGRRIAKKSGKVYYENRENRIDRKQPPKTYPKLEDGGEVLMTFEEFKRKLPELHDIKWGDKGVKYIAKRNPYTDTIMYFKNGRRNSEKVSLNKAYEHYKYFVEKGQKYEDGGLMKDFNKNFTTAYILQQQLAQKEAEKSGAYTGEDNDYNYSTIYYSERYYPSREFDGQVFASKQLHDDMRDASGSLKGSKEKDIEQSVTAYFEEDIVKKTSGKNLHQMWKDGKGVNVEKKKKGWFFKDGGMMAKGGYVAVGEKDGYWTIMSTPSTKENAQKVIDMGVPRGEVGKVVTLAEAKAHKKTIGGEYLEYGGILQPMTGGVNADPRFDIYDTGAFMKKGGKVKRAMRYEDGGMNEGGEFEYLIMYRSDNPTYQNEDGFEGNPPDSMYADSAFDVLDYLRENMPDDVEVISIEEASDVYKKGGYMAKGGKIKDQYDGKTPEEVWNNLSKMQKQHFLYDHKDDIESYRGEEFGELKSMEIIKAYNSNYNELDKNIRNRFDNHVREGQYAYGGILQPMTGGVNADPRFDIYDTGAFMKKGGYMNEGGLVKVKWSDAEYGDSARVIAENKMGLILKPYGQKFHLKFPDGTEKTYTANELEFYKEEEYASGGGIPEGYHMMPDGTIMADSAHMAMGGQTKKYADWVDKKNELEKEISKLEKSIDADYSDKEVGKLTKEKREKLDDKKEELKRHLKELNSMAMGGALEHGLKEGDEIVMVQENVLVVMNKKTGETVFVDIETGKREDASHLKDKLMMMSMAEGGIVEHGLKKGDEIVLAGGYLMIVKNDGKYFKINISQGSRVEVDKPEELKSMAKGGKVKFRVSEIEERKDGNLNVIEDGKKYVVAYSADGYKNPYGITFEEEDTFRSLSKDAKAKKVYLKLKPKIEEYLSKKMAKGGKVKFADKVASVKKSLLERKKVPKAVQKDYGKTFSPAEAEDSAKRIVGAQTYAERIKYLAKKNKK